MSIINRKRLFSAAVGAISFIKIYDIKKNNILLEMSCTGGVTITEDQFKEYNTRNPHFAAEIEPIPIHRNSLSLGKKTMKKLINKIK